VSYRLRGRGLCAVEGELTIQAKPAHPPTRSMDHGSTACTYIHTQCTMLCSISVGRGEDSAARRSYSYLMVQSLGRRLGLPATPARQFWRAMHAASSTTTRIVGLDAAESRPGPLRSPRRACPEQSPPSSHGTRGPEAGLAAPLPRPRISPRLHGGAGSSVSGRSARRQARDRWARRRSGQVRLSNVSEAATLREASRTPRGRMADGGWRRVAGLGPVRLARILGRGGSIKTSACS